tara:strand:- start:1282 stop:2598 length:1317 start_codon:yes stop_codon:yes gene_type:complete
MSLFSLQTNQDAKYPSVLLAIMPLSFIAGNMIININLVLFIISAFFSYKKEIFSFRLDLIDKIISTFFFIVLFTGVYNDIFFYLEKSWRADFSTTIKSILFFKYLIFYLVLRFCVEKKSLNLKYFFISSSLASIFVCFDIFYQSIFGKDIFGYGTEGMGRKLGGPFGDELIAGGFIQRFSLFSFFIVPLFFLKFRNYSKVLIPILFLIFFTGIMFSGNRMPLIMFIFTLFLTLVFQKQVRKYFLHFCFIIVTAFLIIFNFNSKVKNNFKNFYMQVTEIKTVVTEEKFDYNKSAYFKEFNTFYDTWLLNKYIGGGIKNFRYYCHYRAPDTSETYKKYKCNMHPHNYYLEILTETGIIGFLIIIVSFLLFFYRSFLKKYFFKSTMKNNHIITPFIFLFIAEIFPIKSTGSFFTTGNATYLFLILAILIGLTRLNSIENKF